MAEQLADGSLFLSWTPADGNGDSVSKYEVSVACAAESMVRVLLAASFELAVWLC